MSVQQDEGRRSSDRPVTQHAAAVDLLPPENLIGQSLHLCYVGQYLGERGVLIRREKVGWNSIQNFIDKENKFSLTKKLNNVSDFSPSHSHEEFSSKSLQVSDEKCTQVSKCQ